MKTVLQYQENEITTISLERYEMLKNYERLVNDIENEMLKNKNKLTKEDAVKLLNKFRSFYGIYMGEDPYRLEIID